ncbi:hypothetical protein LINPERHAP1_LOCUS21512 [Linum perenne]
MHKYLTEYGEYLTEYGERRRRETLERDEMPEIEETHAETRLETDKMLDRDRRLETSCRRRDAEMSCLRRDAEIERPGERHRERDAGREIPGKRRWERDTGRDTPTDSGDASSH